jgi:hypothetical protein
MSPVDAALIRKYIKILRVDSCAILELSMLKVDTLRVKVLNDFKIALPASIEERRCLFFVLSVKVNPVLLSKKLKHNQVTILASNMSQSSVQVASIL